MYGGANKLFISKNFELLQNHKLQTSRSVKIKNQNNHTYFHLIHQKHNKLSTKSIINKQQVSYRIFRKRTHHRCNMITCVTNTTFHIISQSRPTYIIHLLFIIDSFELPQLWNTNKQDKSMFFIPFQTAIH